MFNEIFGFSPSIDLIDLQVPELFNPNQFWEVIAGTYGYNTSSCKDTAIRNPYIWVAHRILFFGLFARDDNVNVPILSRLYV